MGQTQVQPLEERLKAELEKPAKDSEETWEHPLTPTPFLWGKPQAQARTLVPTGQADRHHLGLSQGSDRGISSGDTPTPAPSGMGPPTGGNSLTWDHRSKGISGLCVKSHAWGGWLSPASVVSRKTSVT